MCDVEGKMVIEKGYICIPVEEYVDLIETNQFMDVLLESLFMNARLSWNEKALSFDSDSLGVILKGFRAWRYNGTFDRLIKLQKESGGTDGKNNK